MKEDHEIIYRSLLTDNPPNPGEVDNTTGIYVPYTLFELWCGFFYVHKNQIMLWDRNYDFSSLSEKTRKSNRLQMPLQRQHFHLSCLKILSVGLAGVWTRDPTLSRTALSQLSWPGGGMASSLYQSIKIQKYTFCYSGTTFGPYNPHCGIEVVILMESSKIIWFNIFFAFRWKEYDCNYKMHV